MKRYLLFSGTKHASTSAGGWLDFKESFDSYDDAIVKIRESQMLSVEANLSNALWFHVVDSQTGKIVAQTK